MAEDPYDDHPLRSKRNRKFPKIDRTKPVSERLPNGAVARRSIADPGPGPHEITVTPLDVNGSPKHEEAVNLSREPEPDVMADAIIEAVAEPVSDGPIPVGLVIPPPDSQPEVEVDTSITVDLSGMTMPEVLLWAGEDPVRRAYALAAERERPKPRKGVLTALDG